MTVSTRKIARLRRAERWLASSGAVSTRAPTPMPADTAVYSPPTWAPAMRAIVTPMAPTALMTTRGERGADEARSCFDARLISTQTSDDSAAKSTISSTGSPVPSAPCPGSMSTVEVSGVPNQPRQIPIASTVRKITVVHATVGARTSRRTGRENRCTSPRMPNNETAMTAR